MFGTVKYHKREIEGAARNDRRARRKTIQHVDERGRTVTLVAMTPPPSAPMVGLFPWELDHSRRLLETRGYVDLYTLSAYCDTLLNRRGYQSKLRMVAPDATIMFSISLVPRSGFAMTLERLIAAVCGERDSIDSVDIIRELEEQVFHVDPTEPRARDIEVESVSFLREKGDRKLKMIIESVTQKRYTYVMADFMFGAVVFDMWTQRKGSAELEIH